MRRALVMAARGWAALGGRSLRRTARRMADLVDAGVICPRPGGCARRRWRAGPTRSTAPSWSAPARVAGRDTADAVAGPLFWGALAGRPARSAHERSTPSTRWSAIARPVTREFGWGAARLDDALGWPVARACAAATVVAATPCGEHAAGALRVWRRDGARHPSPNAGRAEAAFAGALGITLGGGNDYDGLIERRPHLGSGPARTRRRCAARSG